VQRILILFLLFLFDFGMYLELAPALRSTANMSLMTFWHVLRNCQHSVSFKQLYSLLFLIFHVFHYMYQTQHFTMCMNIFFLKNRDNESQKCNTFFMVETLFIHGKNTIYIKDHVSCDICTQSFGKQMEFYYKTIKSSLTSGKNLINDAVRRILICHLP